MTEIVPKKAAFARNFAVLAGGNLVSQVISIALVPIITRIYTTEEFGEFAIVAALAMTIIPASNLRFNAAVLLPTADRDSAALVWLSVAFNAMLVLLLSVALALVLPTRVFSLPQTQSWLLYTIPVIVVFGGWQLTTEAYALRKKAFAAIAIGAVSARLLERIAGIMAGLIPTGAVGLLAARALGLATNVAVTLGGTAKTTSLRESLVCSFADIRRVFVEYRSFAIYSVSATIQQLSRQAPIFLLGFFYSPAIAGLYALAFRVLAEPIQAIGGALGRSFAQRAAQDSREGEDLADITLRLFRYIIMVVIPPMAVLAVVAPTAFAWAFGPEWEASGRFVRIIAPVFVFSFLIRALGSLFDVLRKQRDQLFFGLTMLVASAGSILVAGLGQSVENVLLVYSIAMTIVLASRVLWFLHQVNASLWRAARYLVRTLASALLVAAIVWLASVSIANATVLVLFAGSTIAIYFGVCIANDAFLRRQILRR